MGVLLVAVTRLPAACRLPPCCPGPIAGATWHEEEEGVIRQTNHHYTQSHHPTFSSPSCCRQEARHTQIPNVSPPSVIVIAVIRVMTASQAGPARWWRTRKEGGRSRGERGAGREGGSKQSTCVHDI